MAFARTLFGDVSPQQLGFTYSHEHIVCVPAHWKERDEKDLLLDDPEKSCKDVQDFVDLGGKTIVDATAIDYGRCVNDVAGISKKTGVQIIGTAGFNKGFLWDARLSARLRGIVGNYETYADWIADKSINELAEHIVREVEEGLENTQYKAGQVKFGTGYNRISPLEEKTIRAAARAFHETKAPVHAHTEAGTMALEQIEILKSEKVPLEYVSFGHMDRNLDSYYHEQIAKTGAFLSFDGINKIKYAPESARISAILSLVRAGYEDQILISGDTARRSYYKHYDYGPGLAFIKSKWIPRFIDEANHAGFDGSALIEKFFIKNPSRCFAFKE
jgi:predicted metal-dependent phosphotriesterase family hydrolase